MHNLRGTDLRVLIAIASCGDADGRAYPGMGRIAAMAGIDRSDVPRSVRRLVAAGVMRQGQIKRRYLD
jgi:DNA-binding MarR family transcriptional regulator